MEKSTNYPLHINVVKLSAIANNILTNNRKYPPCRLCSKWLYCHQKEKCNCEIKDIVCSLHHKKFIDIIKALHTNNNIMVKSSSNFMVLQLLNAIRNSYPVVITINGKTKYILDTPSNNSFLLSKLKTLVLVVNFLTVTSTINDTDIHIDSLLKKIICRKLIFINSN